MGKEFELVDNKKAAELLDVEQAKPRNAISEFVNSAVYTATSAPLRGLAQIADHNLQTNIDKSVKGTFEAMGVRAPEPAQFNTSNWYAQQLGGAVGMTIPFLALRGGVKGTASLAFGETAVKSALDTGVTHSLSRFAVQEAALSGTAGFLYGSLLNPSDEKVVGTADFGKDRLKHGVSDLAVFGSLSLTSPFIGKGLATGSTFLEGRLASPVLKDGLAATLRGPLLPGALSGVPAGLVAAEATALRDGRLLPTGQELKESVTGMVVVGGTLSTAHWLGAQREGSNVTNARHLTDKVGLTKAADGSIADFKIVEGKDQLSRFHNEVKGGATNAEAQVVVRQRIETLSSALQGPAGRVWGDARVLQLEHRGNGIMPARTAGSFGLIGTCSILEGPASARDVFTGRSNAADRTVMLTPRSNFEQFSLSVGKDSANKASSFPVSERLSPVALGEESSEAGKPPADASAAKPEGSGPVARPYKRFYGPNETPREDGFNIFGRKLEMSDSAPLGFNKTGTVSDISKATSIATFGRDATGWPYISVDYGRELWSMNGRSIRPGKTYLDVKGGDKLVFDNSLVFDFQKKGYAGTEGNPPSYEMQLHYRVDAELAKKLAPTESADGTRPGDRDSGRFGDRDAGRDRRDDRGGRFGDRDGGRFGDRDGGRFGDRDGRFRDGPETPPENLRPPRPRGDFEIGEGKFRVFGKMLVRPGDATMIPLFKDGKRGSVVANDTMAKFGLDAKGDAYFQVNHGQELWSLNGAPIEAKKPYPISTTDKLIFNGNEFELATKRTPHGKEALDLGLKPTPQAQKSAGSTEAPEGGASGGSALKPELNMIPEGLFVERSYVASQADVQRLMGTYETVQKEMAARKAAEAAEQEIPLETRPAETVPAENRTAPVDTSAEAKPTASEPTGVESRPVETEAKSGPPEAETGVERTTKPTETETNGGGATTSSLDSLLNAASVDGVLKPLVLTDEARAFPKEAVKAPEAKITNPAEVLENDLVSVNGKSLGRGAELKIGRFQGIDIQLAKDPSIANMHGYVGLTAEGQLYIRNTSANGMQINGQAIESGQNVLIKPNDVVTVGRNNRTIEIKVDRPE